MPPVVLAVATHTGEAITTGVVSAGFALLSWAGFRRGKASLGWFYAAAAALAVVLTALAAAGHVFHGW